MPNITRRALLIGTVVSPMSLSISLSISGHAALLKGASQLIASAADSTSESLDKKIGYIQSYIGAHPTHQGIQHINDIPTQFFEYRETGFRVKFNVYGLLIHDTDTSIDVKKDTSIGVKNWFFYDARHNGLGTIDRLIIVPGELDTKEEALIEKNLYDSDEMLKTELISSITKSENGSSYYRPFHKRVILIRNPDNSVTLYDFNIKLIGKSRNALNDMTTNYQTAVNHVLAKLQ